MRLIISILSAATLCAGAEPLLLQKPTLNKTHIVFVYAGDLWSAPRDGGDAVRITSGPGNETDPAFYRGALDEDLADIDRGLRSPGNSRLLRRNCSWYPLKLTMPRPGIEFGEGASPASRRRGGA